MRLPPFQDLLDGNREAVYRFLVAAVGHQDADDCFQETFLAALRAYPRLERADNLRGWLLTIARNKALDHHRRRHSIPFPPTGCPRPPPRPPIPTTPRSGLQSGGSRPSR